MGRLLNTFLIFSALTFSNSILIADETGAQVQADQNFIAPHTLHVFDTTFGHEPGTNSLNALPPINVHTTLVAPESPAEFDTLVSATPKNSTVTVVAGAEDQTLIDSAIQELEKNGVAATAISVQIIPKEFEEAEPLSQVSAAKPRTFRDLFSNPTRSQVVIGTVLTGANLLANYVSTVVHLGAHSPKVIEGILAGAILTAAFAIWQPTADRLYGAKFKDPSQSVSSLTKQGRRVAMDWITREALRAIMGAVGQAHSAFSWTGQFDIMKNVFQFAILGSVFSRTRESTFEGKSLQNVGMLMSLDMGVLTAILNVLSNNKDGFGTWYPFGHAHELLTFSVVDASVIALYLGSIVLMKTKPKFVIRMLRHELNLFGLNDQCEIDMDLAHPQLPSFAD